MGTPRAPQQLRGLGRLAIALALSAGCSGSIGDGAGAPGMGGPVGPGGGAGAPGTGGAPSTMVPGAGGSSGTVSNPAPAQRCDDGVVRSGRGPLRRLTRFEYNNTVRDLLGDTTSPGNALPSEEVGNGFGNDADALSVSSLLAEQYASVAEGIARRATTTAATWAKLAPCAATATAATEAACARTVIEGFAARAYRRPLAAGEADALLTLQRTIRAKDTFPGSIAAVIEAVLQTPDFLYRLEWGVPERDRPTLRRPTGHEMATRLSYLYWATMPDDTLRAAAEKGELSTAQGVATHAQRMLADARARPVIRFFFDNFLPISGLADLERDRTLFPKFSSSVGALMREETHRLLEHEIFDGTGTWAGAFTAPHTFVNAALATFYGMTGVTGDSFRKAPVDTTRRLGFLTHAGVMAGTTHSNETSPVVRGSFVVQKLMCRIIPLPSAEIAEQIKPPEPYTGKTARDRYTAHSKDPACAVCHKLMDPVGLALENYDPVGAFRDRENGVLIDASGGVPGVEGTARGPVDLVKQLASARDTHACFAANWMQFAYGRTLGAGDECTRAAVESAFEKSGNDVRKLLASLATTDAFLYLPTVKE